MPPATTSIWARPKLTDYWDWQQDALNRHANLLETVSGAERPQALAEIRACVQERAAAYDNDMLLTSAWVIAEDLYKGFSNQIHRTSDALLDYLGASAGSFFEALKARGFVLQYVIDNTFEMTEFGLGFPLYLFPNLFNAAGIMYVCPQHAATMLMQDDGHAKDEYVALMPRYIDRGRDLANGGLAKAHDERRHFAFLDCASDATAPPLAHAGRGQPGVLWVYRSEPPVAGSRCLVVPPPGIEPPLLKTVSKIATPAAKKRSRVRKS